MGTILHYLYPYVKFGKFTTVFLIVVGIILVLKLLPKIRLPLSNLSLFILILALGLFLRIEWLGYSAHTPMSHWNKTHMLENDWINVHAIELSQQGIWFHGSNGLPSGRRPIGYPLFLALFYKIFGVTLLVPWILNLVLYGLTIHFLFLMARKMFGEPIALITAFLFAVYPMSIYSIKLLTDEHLFLPVWYAGLYMLFQILDGRRIKWDWLWLGIIFGYVTMIRTHTIFMPLIVGAVFLFLKCSWREVLGKIVLVALVMQLINLPWVIRNYRVWKVPVLYSATGYFVYAQVNSTAAPDGGGHVPHKGDAEYSPELDAAIQSGNEGRVHQIANREMSKWIRRHPIRFLELGTARLLDFMCFNRKSGVWALWTQYYPGSFDPSRPLPPKLKKSLEEYAFVFYYLIFFAWLFGCFLLTKHWKGLLPLARHCLLILGLCFLFWFAEHTVIYPDRKYRFPLEPIMFFAAAYFFYNIRIPNSLITQCQKRLCPQK